MISTATDLQNALREILETLLDARGGDDELAELAEVLDGVRRIRSYREAQVLTTDPGLVLETEDGEELHVTIGD